MYLPLHRGGNHATLTYTHQTLRLNEWVSLCTDEHQGGSGDILTALQLDCYLYGELQKKVNYDLYNEEIHKAEQKANTSKKLEITGKTSTPQARKT